MAGAEENIKIAQTPEPAKQVHIDQDVKVFIHRSEYEVSAIGLSSWTGNLYK